MKKLIFSLSVFLPALVFAKADVCVQKLQSAVSPRGTCEIFSTPCEVPDDWKKVPSCKDVKPVRKKGERDTFNRRFGSEHWKKIKSRRDVNKGKVRNRSKYIRRGRTGFIQSTKLLNREKPLAQKNKRKQTFAKRKAFDKAPAFFRKQSTKRGGLGKKGKISKKEKYQQRVKKWGQNRPLIKNATQMNREGGFSNKPKWEVQGRTHFRERKIGSTKYWQRPKPKKRTKRRSRRSITNKRSWKGGRLEGSLD